MQAEALDAQRAAREEQERRDRELAARLQMETDEDSAGSLSTAPAREANMWVYTYRNNLVFIQINIKHNFFLQKIQVPSDKVNKI